MPLRLHRYYGAGYLHFITTSCYQRRPFLASAMSRDLFLEVLEHTRRLYRFVIKGYVVMPEHVHLLMAEPERGNPSTIMQVLKHSFARKLIRAAPPFAKFEGWEPHSERHVWTPRFYDFVVFTDDKKVEKLRYIHRNPVKRGLVLEPQDWRWSSFRHYAYDERGPVLIDEQQEAKLTICEVAVS